MLIYLVEDDNSIRELVAYTLHSAGFEAEGFERPSAFWRACAERRPDLVLLDLMLPEEDGISILKKLRQAPETARLPILLLTAKSSEYDKVLGLDSGADDYVAKPFGMMELLARVKALLRRTEQAESEEVYRLGTLSVNKTRHEVYAAGQEVTLTLKEFDLLCLLLEKQGTRADERPAFKPHLGAMALMEKAVLWMCIFALCGRSWGNVANISKRCVV